MMTPSGMADFIRVSMGFPLPVSAQLTGWGTGIVGELTSFGKISNPPGTVDGIAPTAGGFLVSGIATNGIIFNLDASRLATAVVAAAGYPSVSAEVTAICAQLVLHIETLGKATFNFGGITGVCTNTPLTPGILTGGTGANGFILNLDGTILATAVHGAAGYPGSLSPELTNFCTAIVTYITANAKLSYLAGTVTATCPAGGGHVASAVATAGLIT